MKVQTFNDYSFINAVVRLVRVGQWNAELTFSGLDEYDREQLAVGTVGTLVTDYVEWVATIKSVSFIYPNIYKVCISGGSGNMSTTTIAENYTDVDGQTVVNSLIDGTEAILSENTPLISENPLNTLRLELGITTSDDQFISLQEAKINKFLNKQIEDHKSVVAALKTYKTKQFQKLDNIVRGKQLTQALKIITKDNSVGWRINHDGNLIFIKDSDTSVLAALPASAVIENGITNGLLSYVVQDELDFFPEPGSYYSDGEESWRIEQTNIYITGGSTSLTIYKKTLTDQLKSAVNKDEEFLFSRSYSAIVDSQNSDGTLKLIPDDVRIAGAGLDNVPIRTPNGITLTVQSGIKCHLAYENSDPMRPYVAGFYQLESNQVGESYIVTIGNPDSAVFAAKSDVSDSRLDALESKINNLISLYNGHIHITTATVGATPTPGVLSPTTSTETPVTPGDSTACEHLKI